MIHARGLVQTFRTRQGREKVEVRAVDGVDLDVAEGEVVGFLGPNGAGKTTTLRMLTTLLRPTAGTATVAGYDVVRESKDVRRSIGYVSQAGGAFSYARAGDEVVDHGMLYGLSRRRGHRARPRAVRAARPARALEAHPKAMSGGQKRRLDICMGLIHDPTLVFLDEPTTGLDPQARANLWEHIADLRRERGATVFLTTHYLDEADVLSDRIMIIDQGRIVASDTAENLKAAVSGDQVDLEVADLARVGDAATALKAIADSVEVDAQHVRGRVPRAGRAVPGLLRELDGNGITLDSIEVHRPTLDDVFLTLTGRSLRDAEAEQSDQPGQPDQPARTGPADSTRSASNRGSRAVNFVRESMIVFRRQVRMNLRNPAWVFIGAMQPVLYLVLFGPLLKPLVDQFGADNAYTFLVPGLLVQLGHVRRLLRRLRPDRGVARGRDRGRAGHPGQPDRPPRGPARP